jgi:hypothetical protein
VSVNQAQAQTWFEKYDDEFETPDSQDDPVFKAQVQNFEQRDPVRSTEETIEHALMLWEKNYCSDEMRKARWKGQERWQGDENIKSRLTRITFCRDFVRRFNQHSTVKIFLNDFRRVGRCGVNAYLPSERGRQATHITTIQAPFAPEYTVMHFNDYDVPTTPRYWGWRNTLLILIMQGICTESQALKMFGHSTGPASIFYKQQLYDHRNRAYREDGKLPF